jgi:Na+-driven multidrug efflux pump
MRQVLFLLPLTILFSKAIGMNGIWIGICTADALNFIYVIIMNIWVRKKVFTKWGKNGSPEAAAEV